MRALSTAATGMEAQQLNVEVIAHNIANMNTTGYKRQRAEFQDLLYQNVERMGVASSDAGTIVPTGVQVGVGVKAGSVYRVTEQGSLTNTTNDYDLAIQGDGYFIVQMPDGRDSYTRAGNFSLSPDGQIVTADGYTVAPGISVPEHHLAPRVLLIFVHGAQLVHYRHWKSRRVRIVQYHREVCLLVRL